MDDHFTSYRSHDDLWLVLGAWGDWAATVVTLAAIVANRMAANTAEAATRRPLWVWDAMFMMLSCWSVEDCGAGPLVGRLPHPLVHVIPDFVLLLP